MLVKQKVNILKDNIMKKKYTNKQITEAIAYWQKQLTESTTITSADKILSEFKKYCIDIDISQYFLRFKLQIADRGFSDEMYDSFDLDDIELKNGTLIFKLKSRSKNNYTCKLSKFFEMAKQKNIKSKNIKNLDAIIIDENNALYQCVHYSVGPEGFSIIIKPKKETDVNNIDFFM